MTTGDQLLQTYLEIGDRTILVALADWLVEQSAEKPGQFVFAECRRGCWMECVGGYFDSDGDQHWWHVMIKSRWSWYTTHRTAVSVADIIAEFCRPILEPVLAARLG